MKSVNHFCDVLKRESTSGYLSGSAPGSPNERGNAMFRVWASASRYMIDFADDFTSEGWLQFDTDQDAAYFGVWVNPVTRQTLTYAEGDWSLVECPDADHYNAEIQDCINFYDEGRIALVIGASGNATEYRQDRSEFLL